MKVVLRPLNMAFLPISWSPTWDSFSSAISVCVLFLGLFSFFPFFFGGGVVGVNSLVVFPAHFNRNNSLLILLQISLLFMCTPALRSSCNPNGRSAVQRRKVAKQTWEIQNTLKSYFHYKHLDSQFPGSQLWAHLGNNCI